jgi:hypothetical protein
MNTATKKSERANSINGMTHPRKTTHAQRREREGEKEKREKKKRTFHLLPVEINQPFAGTILCRLVLFYLPYIDCNPFL